MIRGAGRVRWILALLVGAMSAAGCISVGYTWMEAPPKITIDTAPVEPNRQNVVSWKGDPVLAVRTGQGEMLFWRAWVKKDFLRTQRMYEVWAFDSDGRFVPVTNVSMGSASPERAPLKDCGG